MIPFTFVPQLLAFVKSPWMIVCVAAAIFLYYQGYISGSEKLNEYIGEQAVAAVKIAQQRAEVDKEVVTKYVRVAGKTQIVTQVVEKEIIKYEKANLDQCELSSASVLLHNAASANTSPADSAGTASAPSGVTAASLTKTCAENYAEYHKVADRLRAILEWDEKQAGIRP